MTENRWLALRGPDSMLHWARPRMSARKKRLLVVAACRMVPHDDPDWQHAVAVAERHADGEATAAEMRQARRRLGLGDFSPEARARRAREPRHASSLRLAAHLATYLNSSEACHALSRVADAFSSLRKPHSHPTLAEFRAEQAELVREVFGNPFRRPALDPAWLAWEGGQVVRLAEAIYAERAFERMPILGDALEEAGCVDPEVLRHCREKRRHARGCWVVDWVLPKE